MNKKKRQCENALIGLSIALGQNTREQERLQEEEAKLRDAIAVVKKRWQKLKQK